MEKGLNAFENSMKRFLITLLVCSVCSKQLLCQTQPSPASMGVVKNISDPVSLFTGTASASVPIYSAMNGAGASVPVVLQYNASGIKVSEEAGPAGLGWNILAGGSITRIIRGIPDEYGDMVEDPENVTGKKINDILDGNVDSEKDLLFFSFPGGSGKFIFDGNLRGYADATVWCERLAQEPNYTTCVSSCLEECEEDGISEERCHQQCPAYCQSFNMPRFACEGGRLEWTTFKTMPYSDLQFKFEYGGPASTSWYITNPQGVVYVFNTPEETTSSTKEPGETSFRDEYEYISTWYLTEIQYPNSDNISFNYSDPVDLETISTKYETLAKVTASSGNVRTLGVDEVLVTESKTQIGTRYLTSIDFTKGSILLNYEEDREDIANGWRLSSIQLNDNAGRVISTTTLNQGYFSSRYSYQEGSTNGCVDGYNCLRLRLDAVYKDGGLVQSFTYRNQEENSGTGINYYELPPKDSYYFDHYGYHNAGGVFGENYQPYPRLANDRIQEKPTLAYNLASGVDRNSEADYALANILTRVNYPTGGAKKYTYEVIQGKVRIKKIEDVDQDDHPVAGSIYSYSDISYRSVLTTRYHVFYDEDDGKDRLSIFQRSSADILALNGADVGYGQVTVSDLLGRGSTEYYFHSDLREAEIKPYKHKYAVSESDGLTDLGEVSTTFNARPFSTYGVKYYDRGAKDLVIVKDGEGNVVSQIDFEYDDYDESSIYAVQNLAVDKLKDEEVYISRYDIVVRPFRLKATTRTTYDNGGSVSTVTTRTYPSSGYITIPTETHVAKSDGYETKTTIDYLGAFAGKNLFGVPYQTETKIKLPSYGVDDFRTINVTKTTFDTFNGLILPRYVYKLETGEPMSTAWTEDDLTLVNEMISYNDKGQLLKARGLDGITKGFVYDADGFLTTTSILPDDTENRRSTAYTYNSLVGLESVTDPNNREVSYEYDNRNRLLLTRDSKGNILQRYRYNTVTDDNEMSANIDVTFNATYGALRHLTHSFSASNLHCPYGDCRVAWDWGDGTTSGNTKSTSHQYSEPGEYTVSLMIMNDEVTDPVTIQETIDIVDYELDVNANIAYNYGCNISGRSHVLSVSDLYCPTEECSFFWDFGDGTSTTTSSSSVQHSYAAGSYTASVTVSDTYSKSNTDQVAVSICQDVSWMLEGINGESAVCPNSSEPPSETGISYSVDLRVPATCIDTDFQYNWSCSKTGGSCYLTVNEFGEAYLSGQYLIDEGTITVSVDVSEVGGCIGGAQSASFTTTVDADNDGCSSGGGGGGEDPDCTIAASVASLTFDSNGGTKTFTVSTDASSYTVSKNRTWIKSVSKAGNTVSVSLDPTTNRNSGGVVTISGNGGCEDTVSIIQEEPESPCGGNCVFRDGECISPDGGECRE